MVRLIGAVLIQWSAYLQGILVTGPHWPWALLLIAPFALGCYLVFADD